VSVALEKSGSGGLSLSVISLCPTTSIGTGELTRVQSRRYSLIGYNPVALTCTSVTLANGVVTGFEYMH
jgi:hypothetical protein